MPLRQSTAIATFAAGLAAALAVAAPAHADTGADAFVSALSNAGLGTADSANAVQLGQSVCPMLAEPGQNIADVAGAVANAGGMSLGPATMFTGLAISIFCPGVVASIGSGQSPVPLSILGL
jgi:hypothetical protein